MLEMLEKFPNDKIILTNADEEKQVELWLVDLPYPMFTQSFDPMKTDPQFYKNFLEEYNFLATEPVYFEHHEWAVESARSIWIETYHFDKDERNLQTLKWFLEANSS
jgi:FMN phosphatase YigB (HAD superfamily)